MLSNSRETGSAAGGPPTSERLGLDAAWFDSIPAALCLMNGAGDLVADNRLFRAYLGAAGAPSVPAASIDEILPAAERARFRDAFNGARATGTPHMLSGRPLPVPSSGAAQWDGCVAPLRDPDGPVAGYLFMLWDTSRLITAERRAAELSQVLTTVNERLTLSALDAQEAAERAEAARLDAERAAAELDGVFAAIRDIVLIYTPEGRVAKANRAALDAFGFNPIGTDMETLFRRLSLRRADGAAVAPATSPVGAALRGELPPLEAFVFTDGEGRERVVEPLVAALTGTRRAFGAVSVWHDITIRKRLLDALQRKTEELEDADRRKDEFLAMLAHELRNPLAPIRSATEILRLRGSDEQDPRWARRVIERQVQHMAHLVDDLLEVSRITTGKITLAKERVEVASIVKQAVETARPGIERREHQLQVSLPATPLYLDADPTRMAQVIGNLLDNAAKYTEPGGSIGIEVQPETTEVVIRVYDSGIGISADLLPRVFDLFMQADASLERSAGGLGVGLTVVRRVVELHGGSVEAFSAGPGQGSEFVICMPRAAPPPAAAEVAPAAPTRAPQRVLVVDDNVDAADSLAYLLETFGHEVRSVHAAAAGLEEARRFAPDIVLLDIGLPGMNGYEVAKALRQQPACAHAMIVALTGYGREEDRQRALHAGFDAHLVKPVDIKTLQEVIARRVAS